MPLATVNDLLETLRQHRLIKPAQLDELSRKIKGKPVEPRAVAQKLIEAGWLTAYQVNQLLQGRGPDLVLGSYVLVDRLGEGGMGQVFKARHQRLDRLVALKVMRKEKLANADAVRRFRREIQIAAQLNHPNIVAAFDADEVGGAHFFTMEYVPGFDLAQMVKQQGKLPVGQACEYVRQAAAGLAHAHQHGLVHRDIKPSNLLVAKVHGGPSVGVLKILDLGLARLAEPEDGDASSLTRDGLVMGTPDYIAPEQAMNAHQVDIRADLYSLGCTFYFLLTGKPPFTGNSGMEIIFKHRLEEPTPVEQVRPEVPATVARVVRKLMAKKPEDRFQTPAELVAAIPAGTDLAGSTVVLASEPGRSPSVLKRCGSLLFTRWGMRAALVVFLLLVVVLPLARLVLRSEPVSPTSGFTNNRQPSLLDQLDPRTIPAAERVEGQPAELVAVLGEHRQRHWGEASSVAFHPGGKLVASGGADGAVRVWDAATMAPLSVAVGHQSGVLSVAFSPDGGTLVSAGGDATVRLWKIQGTEVKAAGFLSGHKAAVSSIAFSPDGTILASACNDTAVRLWDMSKPEPPLRATLQRHTAAVFSVSVSPDGKMLASFGNDYLVRLWDLTVMPPGELAAFEPHVQRGIAHIAFAPDGKTLVTCNSTDQSVRLWDVSQGKPQQRDELRGHRPGVGTVVFTRDGKEWAVGCGDGSIVLWDMSGAEAKRRAAVAAHAAQVRSLAYAPDGKRLVSSSADTTVRMWDVSGPLRELTTLNEPFSTLRAVAFAPDNKTLAAAGSDTHIRIWGFPPGQPRMQTILKGHQGIVHGLAYSPDGRTLVSSSQDATARVWDLATAKPSERDQLRRTSKSNISSVAMTADGKTVAIGGFDFTVQLFDLSGAKAREGELLKGHSNGVSSVAFFPDGNTLASCSYDDTVRLWDLRPGQRRDRDVLKGHNRPVVALAVSPDGQTVASASYDATIRLWDVSGPTAKQRAVIKDQTYTVLGLAFSPDGKSLASGSWNGQLIFSDTLTGKPLRHLRLPGSVNDLSFSSDGRYLATGNGNGTVYILRLAPPGE